MNEISGMALMQNWTNEFKLSGVLKRKPKVYEKAGKQYCYATLYQAVQKPNKDPYYKRFNLLATLPDQIAKLTAIENQAIISVFGAINSYYDTDKRYTQVSLNVFYTKVDQILNEPFETEGTFVAKPVVDAEKLTDNETSVADDDLPF